MAKKKTNLVCLDAQTYVWGVKKEAIPEQRGMIDKCVRFFNYLSDESKVIVLPTPIITELLMPCDEEESQKLMKLFSENFVIKPFDIIASGKCAEIIRKNRSDEAKEQIPKRRLKYDSMIAAIAIASDCDTVYSHDGGLRPGVPLPSHSTTRSCTV